MKKRVLSLVLVVLMLLSLMPSAALAAGTDSGISYTLSGGVLTVSGNGACSDSWKEQFDESAVESVVIEDGVTGIGRAAFSDCTALKSVSFGKDVASIGAYVFFKCVSLESIAVPDSVTSIGNSVFSGCTSLKSATIPDSVTSIDTNLFRDCTALTTVTLSKNLASLSDYTFYGCASLESVTVPSGVSGIGAYAFYNCASLKSITVPDGAASIGDYAFYGCAALESAAIPNSVTALGYSAFSGCSALKSVTIPAGVTNIDKYAFSGCSALKSVTIPAGVTNIDKYAFSGCSALESVTIPNSVTGIGDEAFRSCTALESVTIPDSVVSIGTYAFSGCTALKSAKLGSSVTSLGDYAFSGCKVLTSLTLGSSLTELGAYAFSECDALESVAIPASVKMIGSSAFYGCDALASITVPDGAEIGWYAFENCTALGSISIGSGVPYIGYRAFNNTAYYNNASNWENTVLYIDGCLIKVREDTSGSYSVKDGTRLIADGAFRDCSFLKSVSLPDSVTKTGRYAFCDCTALESVSLPDSITELSDSTFRGCKALAGITIPNSVTNLGNYVFYCCFALTTIAIPDSVNSLGESAFYGCSKLRGITVPKGVTSIGYKSFYTCSALTVVVLPDSVTSIGEYAFTGCAEIADVYYSGTQTQWNAISVEDGNAHLTHTTIHCNSTQHPHKYGYAITDPTCTERGYITHTCDCGSTYVDNYVDALGHDYADGVCTVCGEKDAGYVPPHTHSYSDKVTAPTCTDKGYTTHSCSCGESYVDSYVAALGHDYKDGVCTRCGADDPNYQPPHEHSYSDKVTAPTCTDKGYTTHSCSCGESYVDSYVAALGHDYTNGVCTRCGEKDSGYVPPHTHSYSDKVTAPSCTEKGYTTHSCSCGESYVDSYVAALGHDYTNGVCTRCGAADPDYKEPVDPIPAVSFTDVPDGAYYAKPVAWAVDKGITGGYPDGTFRPMNVCTRAQIVTFIWRANGSPEPLGTAKGFTDVKEGTYYYKAVLWAAEKGITGGFDDGGFHPDELVTRAQAMTFLWRANNKPTVPAGTVNTFKDVPEGAYYHDAVLWAVANGITGGYDSTQFGSMDGCTRAQIVTFLYRNMA